MITGFQASYSYNSYHTITAATNSPSKAQFDSVTLSGGTTDPDNQGEYGWFDIIDSSTSTYYRSTKFWGRTLKGTSTAEYPNHNAHVQDLYTQTDVWTGSKGVFGPLQYKTSDKIVYTK